MGGAGLRQGLRETGTVLPVEPALPPGDSGGRAWCPQNRPILPPAVWCIGLHQRIWRQGAVPLCRSATGPVA